MFTLPPLPYAYNALEPHIEEATMRIHHDKHHATYVQNLNDALTQHKELAEMEVKDILSDLTKVPEDVRTKVRNNAGGHFNHSLFWELMSPASTKEPKGKLLDAIKGEFGDFATFQEKFTAAAMGRFGSGWAWLIIDGGKLTITDTPNQDSPQMEGKYPILGLDVWEHAYYLKYQNRRADYIKAWWNVVNWARVEELFHD